ncbi:MAG: PhzF family phenazine biosynthesis protein [Spirochaetes bacterium]|nr:PhzF family phenazine biosynthesis protein [Spirochaetota bacterium]
MKSFAFKKLDAFTSGLSSGNPAGYIRLSGISEISESEMQRIAYELKNFVSEVGYVAPSGDDGVDYTIRYFSCEKEVPFCGHATVAIAYELVKENTSISSRPHFSISTKKGILRIENRVEHENLVYIQAPLPVFIECGVDVASLADALNISTRDIDSTIPLGIVNAGQNTLLVPLRNSETCITCSPDYNALRNYSFKNNVEVINIYTSNTVHEENDFRTRVFAPTFGYLEDPATGSGNAALGYYLINQNRWNVERLIIEQGVDRENPNIVVLRKIHDTEILIGGRGVARIQGEYLLN